MLANLTWEQFQGWQAYYALEPWGEERADLRNGLLCALTANINRDPKKGKAFGPADFMPFVKQDGATGNSTGKGKSVDEQRAAFETFAANVKRMGKTGERQAALAKKIEQRRAEREKRLTRKRGKGAEH